MPTHTVTRTYEVVVHGLFMGERNDNLIMNTKDLVEYCSMNGWSYAGLIGAATRYADVGDNDASLYLIEWVVTNDGKTSQDWVVAKDTEDNRVLCGPVRVTAREVDEEIDT